MTNSQPIRSKCFTVTVSPEYRDGRILVLTAEEAKIVAKGLLHLEANPSYPQELFNWAEEVYFG